MTLILKSQPVILSNPSDTSVCAGTTVQFEILASNAAFYQWQEHDGTGWFDIEDDVSYAQGENTATLTLIDVITGLDGYRYRCYIEDEFGESIISEDATLHVYETPLINSHPVNHEVCKNETAIFEVSAENATNYQWQENRGTGWYELSDNSFYQGSQSPELQIFTVFGINNYEYRCKVFNNSCFEVSEQALLGVNPLPQVYHLSGGGSICEGEEGVNISLNGSQQGINYELIKDETTTVSVVSGTGEAFDFGYFHQQGTYTARAVDGESSCTNVMSGQVDIEVFPLPESYDLTGEKFYCEGGSGTSLTLESSEQNILYELLLNGNATGYQIQGTGGAISFVNINTPGSYSVKAINAQTGCDTFMNNTVTVQEVPEPEVYLFTGNGIYCEGSEGADLTLTGSQTGVAYNLLKDGELTNFSLTGTGDSLYFVNITEEGNYAVKAVNDTASCEVMMEGSIELEEQPSPEAYNLSGDDYLCPGGQALIRLEGSEIGTNYKLYRNGANLNNSREGTGESLEFIVNQPGTYTIIASNQSSGCITPMEGEAVVEETVEVIAGAGPDKEVEEGGSVILEGSATGGSGEYSYKWLPVELLINSEVAQPSTVAMTSPQLFTLEVTDGVTGCVSEKDTTTVTIRDGVFGVEAYASNDSICQGEPVQLFTLVQGGSGSYEYYWYSADGAFTSEENNPVIHPETTGSYFIEVDDGTSVVIDTVNVIVTQNPEIFTLTGEESFCANETGAELQLTGSEADADYQLFRNGFFFDLLQNPESFLVSTEGDFTIKAIREGCESEMDGSVEVTVFDVPYASAGEDKMIYEGETTQLSGQGFGGSGAYTYQWEPAESLENSAIQSPVTEPLFSNTIFSLSVANEQTGCQSEADSVSVYVEGSQLTLEVASSKELICSGSGVTLTALAGGGTGNFTYQWFSNPPGFSSADSVTHAYPTTSTWFMVTIDDGVSTLTDSVQVNIADNPEAYEITGGGQMCKGGAGRTIGLTGSETGVYYELLSEANEIVEVVGGTGNMVSFGVIDKPGQYHAIGTNASSGCESSMEGMADLYEVETPAAFAGEDQVIGFNQQASLNGYGTGGTGNYAYFWSPAGKVLNPIQASTATVNLSSSEAFTLEVTDESSGCTSKPDTVLVHVSGNTLSLQLEASSQNICSGEQIQLFALASGGTGLYSYNWSSDPPGLSGQGNTQTVAPFDTTSYSVEVTDGENTVSKTIEVAVTKKPLVEAGQDITISYGEQAQISAAAVNGSGDYSFQWSPHGYISNSSGPIIQTITLRQDTKYFVEAIDNQSGCYSATDSVNVVVEGNDLSGVLVASDDTVCSGEQVNLMIIASGGEGAYDYSWTSSQGDIGSQQPSIITTVDSTTTFYVEISDEVATWTDSIKVIAIPSPQKYLLTGDEYFCENETEAFFTLQNSHSGIRYQLERNGFFTGAVEYGTGQPVVFDHAAQQGFYAVKAINQVNHCVSAMPGGVDLKQAGAPFQFLLSGGGTYCENDTLIIELAGTQQEVHYTLFREEQALDTIRGDGTSQFFSRIADSGLYYVLAQNFTTGCSTVMSDSVRVFTSPVPDVELTNDTTIYTGQAITLEASGGVSYLWNTTPISETSTITVSPRNTIVYRLRVSNAEGCTATDSVKVFVVDPSEVEIEVNAFTPNGDGINDIFLKGYDIKVFNRWGKILFEGTEGWDGTYKGSPVPAGTYYYVLTSNEGNQSQTAKGSVTVIRRNE